MNSLITDLSTLTTIPAPSLKQLVKKAEYCICDSVEETALKDESLTEINIGIGVLQINAEDNQLKYRFIPSRELGDSIKATLIDKKNPLVETAEETLVKRIINTYKDFI